MSEKFEDEKPGKFSDEDFERQFGAPLATGELDYKEELVSGERTKSHGSQEEVPTPPIDPERVVFTTHALDRFTERLKQQTGEIISDPEKAALELLAGAKEEGAIGRGNRVLRLMKHQYEEARYFLNAGWRFVILERDGKFFIKTIERKKPKR